METGRSAPGAQATGGNGKAAVNETRIMASHTVAAKPLYFSFLKITNIQSKLRFTPSDDVSV